MPSQEEYLDDLLKDLKREQADASENMRNESAAAKEQEADAALNGAGFDMSDMEAFLRAAEEIHAELSVPEQAAAGEAGPGESAAHREAGPGESAAHREAGPGESAAHGEAGPGEAAEHREAAPEAADIFSESETDIRNEEISAGNNDKAGNDGIYDEDLLLEPAADLTAEENRDEAPVTEDLYDFSEDDIERLLLAGNEEKEREKQEENGSIQETSGSPDTAADTDDILKILNAADDTDEDLQDIYNMLQSADRDEPIREDLTGDSGGDNTDEAYQETAADEATDEAIDEAAGKAPDKAAEKRAKREAKKAERKAKKEAKKAGGKKAEKEQNEQLQPEEFGELDSLLGIEGEEETQDAAKMEDPLGIFAFDEADNEELMHIPEPDKEEKQKLSRKGKSFWEKLLDFFTEEDEEEDDEEIKLSNENKNILKEMKQEKAGKKAGRGAKKRKNADGEENGEEKPDDKKAKKAKRNGKKQEAAEDTFSEAALEEPGKALSVRKILPVALTCFSLGAVIIILAVLSADFAGRNEGRKAYYNQDYQACYENLLGKNLNESEQVMLHKSECILKTELWMQRYTFWTQQGLETEALDSLIQAVYDYPLLYEFAAQWNAAAEVSESYAGILEILSGQYGLTEEQAKEIAAVEDDTEYTRIVTDIAGGMSYTGQMGEQETSEQEIPDQEAAPEETIPDRLPEEEGILQEEFVDNNGSF